MWGNIIRYITFISNKKDVGVRKSRPHSFGLGETGGKMCIVVMLPLSLHSLQGSHIRFKYPVKYAFIYATTIWKPITKTGRLLRGLESHTVKPMSNRGLGDLSLHYDTVVVEYTHIFRRNYNTWCRGKPLEWTHASKEHLPSLSWAYSGGLF